MTTSPTAARGGLLARHRTGFWVAVALVTVLVAVGVVTFVRSRPGPGSGPGATAFPLKVSGNGRYLVDQRDEPFFYAGDTCWTLLSYLSLRDAKRLIDIRRAQGFSAVQTVLEPLGRTTTDRVRAEPFVDGDVTRPDEGYWSVVDQIMAYAARRGMLLYVVPMWMSSYGADGRTLPTTSQLQAYMTWIGHR